MVLEDQRRPRRCGHADGKRVLPPGESLAATGADVVLADGVRSVERIRRTRAVVGVKPVLLCSTTSRAAGPPPDLARRAVRAGRRRGDLQHAVSVAAHRAFDAAPTELKSADGRLAPVEEHTGVGVAESAALLERNPPRSRGDGGAPTTR